LTIKNREAWEAKAENWTRFARTLEHDPYWYYRDAFFDGVLVHFHSDNSGSIPTLIPTMGSQRVPQCPGASHPPKDAVHLTSEIGTLRDASGRSEILLTSLIMLRSLVRFQLASLPPHEGTSRW
jgi:hypothetical protein